MSLTDFEETLRFDKGFNNLKERTNQDIWYLVLDTGNCYSPSMTLRFTETSPFKDLNIAFPIIF